MCAKALRTCQKMKLTDVKHSKFEVALGAADKGKSTLPQS